MELQRVKEDYFSEILLYYLFVLSTLYFLNLFNIKGQEVIFINGLHNTSLDIFFSVITEFGNGALFVPVILLAAFKSYRLALMGIASWLIHGLICLVLKRIVFADFKRPAALLDNSLLHFVPGINVHHHYSFPSGHTATIFCFAVFVSLMYRSRLLAFTMLLLAIAVGVSRIYLLQHFMEDVLVGSVIGTVTAFAFYHYFTVTKFSSWMDSNLSVFFRERAQRPQGR